MSDEIESLRRQLEIRQRNPRFLEERKALYGSFDTPIHLMNQSRDAFQTRI